MCFRKSKHIEAVLQSVRALELDQGSKNALVLQYKLVLESYRKRVRKYSVAFHSLRLIITIGSLIVPALLSVQYTNGNTTIADISTQMYWVVWVLSLFVTISNGVMTLVKIDKKYFSLHTVYHQLLSEGWQFIHLTGKYNGQKTPGHAPTHENQFQHFSHAIDKIHMKCIEEEYYKVNEANQSGSNEPIVPASPFPAISSTRSQRISQVNLNGSGTPATAIAALRRQNSSSNTQTLATIEETSEGSGVDEQDTSAVSVPGIVPQQASSR